MDWKFEKICIQYLTQGWNVKVSRCNAGLAREII